MPGPLVCAGAVLACTFGLAPGVLDVLPLARPLVAGRPVANAHDRLPLVNVKPFGLCTSLANPAVASATAAALGALTPAPCMPVLPGPWLAGSTTATVAGAPALTVTSQCQCLYGGTISVTAPGQLTVAAPS